MIAMSTATPAAAETKFCTVSPAICVRWLIVSSPLYHCQFVLVMKLTATLNAPIGATSDTSVGLNGSDDWNRCSRYTARKEKMLNDSNEMA
jgi:hypothetical protein